MTIRKKFYWIIHVHGSHASTLVNHYMSKPIVSLQFRSFHIGLNNYDFTFQKFLEKFILRCLDVYERFTYDQLPGIWSISVQGRSAIMLISSGWMSGVSDQIRTVESREHEARTNGRLGCDVRPETKIECWIFLLRICSKVKWAAKVISSSKSERFNNGNRLGKECRDKPCGRAPY